MNEETYEIYRSAYTIAQIEASIGKTPIIDETTKEWMIWDIAAMQYVGTGISASAQQSAADAAASAAAAAQSAAGAAADRAATQTAAQSATSSAAAAQGSRDSAAASATAAAASAASVDADELNRRILAAFPVGSASGALVSIQDGADGIPPKTLIVNIDPVQAGSGDPSPSNVRPISGWTGANIVVSPTQDAADGTTYAVNWQSESGTVYGGTLTDNGDGTWTLNVEKVGVIVDGTTTAIAAFDNEMDTENAVACYFTTSPALVKVNDYSGKIFCDKMPPLSIAAARGGSPFTDYKNLIEGMDCSVAGYRRAGQSGNNYLYFSFNTTTYPDFSGKDVADANAWFAVNPVQVVYELATPISYTITAESVRTLLGVNNVWADCGDVAELVYRADPTLYVEERLRSVKRIIAGVETGTTATANYSVGDLLIVGDTLYKATAAIASGENIVEGTNVAATTVAEQLLLLANI